MKSAPLSLIAGIGAAGLLAGVAATAAPTT
jgi:hypothetical protein